MRFLIQLFKRSRTRFKSVKHKRLRSMLFESMEGRMLCAIDSSDAIDMVRSTAAVKNAEQAVIASGRPQTIRVSGSIANTQQLDHSFLEKATLRGTYTADVTIRQEKGALVEKYNFHGSLSGQSKLEDIDSAAISSDVRVAGTYWYSSNKRTPLFVVSTDWQSDAITDMQVLSGPPRGTNYKLEMLAKNGREYGNKLSGLSTSELVGQTVRNAVPLKTSLGNWSIDTIKKLEAIKIPGVDVQKELSNLSIVADVFATAGSRSNEQIYQDLLKADTFVVGIKSEADLLRFAEGGVTSIVGAKFNLEKSWDYVLANIPIVSNAPLFGGLVTASLGTEASLGVSVKLAGMFAADTRGFGFTEGTSLTVQAKLEAQIKGSVAFVGIDKWSLVGAEVKAGVFAGIKFRFVVGALGANAEDLRHGAILYVTSNKVQRGSFASYLSAEFSADVGAFVKSKVTVLGFVVWKKTKERSWEVFKNEVFVAQLSLRQ